MNFLGILFAVSYLAMMISKPAKNSDARYYK
jgi:hypothetical protein